MAERDAVVVGGGLAGITAALRLADAGRSVTLVEARPRLGRRGVLVPARRAVDRQRPARLPALLHAYRGLLDRLGGRPGDPAAAPRHPDPAGGRAHGPGCSRTAGRAGAAAPVGVAGRLRPARAGATGCGPCAARWPCAASTRPTRRSTARRWAASCAARPERRDDLGALGHRRHRDAEPRPGRGVARPGGQGVSHRPARPRAGAPTSATRRVRWASCIRRGR